MTLYINTASQAETIIALIVKDKRIVSKKFKFARHQAEKLLPTIDKLLQANKFKLADIEKIMVASHGGSFTSLRIGVVTANALGYALKVPVISEETGKADKIFSGYSLIEPVYDSEPNIGQPKKRDF
jgi:tRNA threonylcarbamoyl adenosine modification protein YeaZ